MQSPIDISLSLSAPFGDYKEKDQVLMRRREKELIIYTKSAVKPRNTVWDRTALGCLISRDLSPV